MRSKVPNLLLAGSTALALAIPLRAQTVQSFEGLSGTALCPFSVVIGQSSIGKVADVTFQGNWLCFTQPATFYSAKTGVARVFPVDNAGFSSANGSFSFDAPVTFAGAWFAGQSSVNFLLAYLGATVATSSSLGLSATPTFLASGYAGPVDKVTVSGSTGPQGQESTLWVMDDVTYTLIPRTIPEPDTVVLVTTALLLLGGLGIRRQRR